eukprot:TRINITY_DN3702_c0_g1_i4.p3 TRINITY_DN3702_c0_g1~~TRINITY_DN3702_c0_g1_i4.p3  ORF type:complete len:112 (-),score=23.75 TRINITY_DN3702_c0_g1_i4:53-388(-)
MFDSFSDIPVFTYFSILYVFFFNDTATTEIYTILFVGSVRCVQETDINSVKTHEFRLPPIVWSQNKQPPPFLPRKSKPKQFKQLAYYNQPCLLYTSPSPRDRQKSRMPSSA